MVINRNTLIVAAIAAALGATTALAQQSPSTTGRMPQQQPQQGMSPHTAPGTGAQMRGAESVTDRDIQAFAMASADVKQIKQKWHPQVTAAKDAQAQEKLERQAWAEMEQAVQKRGLTVDQYNQIAQLAQSNPDVQRKVERQQNPQRTQ